MVFSAVGINSQLHTIQSVFYLIKLKQKLFLFFNGLIKIGQSILS